MIHYRADLIRPVVQPYGVLEFTEEVIYTLWRIECLHTVHGLDSVWIKTLFDLLDEVDRLHADVSFLAQIGVEECSKEKYPCFVFSGSQ